MPAASMKQLLESGVHFGHQTRRWNPKMKPYIFTERAGIHIIDLQQTTVLLDRAYDFVRNIASRGGTVLFVGTKKQCQDIIRDEASRVGMPYVSHRWLGGLLTNFTTIENRIKRMHELRKLKEEDQLSLLPTKERMAMERELEKLEINLGGVSNMTRLPDAVFVADPKREAIATKEVNKLGMPLIGLVDTNCDPDEVDYLIPGNDDAIRSCSLIVKTLARAVEEGRQKVQVAEFLAAEAARAATEMQVTSTAPGYGGEAGPAFGEAPPSRVSRVTRPAAGEGRSGGPGRPGAERRPGGPGRSGDQGRAGAGGRSGGPGRPGPREGGAGRDAPARRPAAARPAAARPAADGRSTPAGKGGPAGPPVAEAPFEGIPVTAVPEEATAPVVEAAAAVETAPVAEGAAVAEADVAAVLEAVAPEAVAESADAAAAEGAAEAAAET